MASQLPAQLLALNPIDMRDALAQLPQRRRPIGTSGVRGSITIHYAGTEEPGATTDEAALAQVRSEARYHINKIWGYTHPKTKQGPIYGDGLMYHIAVLPSGRPVICRELHAILYSCANEIGNRTSVHVTTLRGVGQAITDQHWAGVEATLDALISIYSLRTREAVKGHREWPRSDGLGQSLCPGPIIFSRLLDYRDGRRQLGKLIGHYEVIAGIGLSARTGPNIGYPKANNNTLVYPKGRRFEADLLVPDDKGMQRSWLREAGTGYYLAADSDLVKFIGA
jgi:hypothetical protein